MLYSVEKGVFFVKMKLTFTFDDPDDLWFLSRICHFVSLDHLVSFDGKNLDLNPLREPLAEKLDKSPRSPLRVEECILLVELLDQYRTMPDAKMKDRAERLQKSLLDAIDPVVETERTDP